MSCRQCEHPLEKGIHTCGEKPKDEWRPTVTMVAGTATDIEYWLVIQIHKLRAENDRLREVLERISRQDELIFVDGCGCAEIAQTALENRSQTSDQ